MLNNSPTRDDDDATCGVSPADGAPRVGEALQGIKLVPSHIKEELAAALTSHGCALTVIRDGTFPLRYGGRLDEVYLCASATFDPLECEVNVDLEIEFGNSL
eukprot:58582-Pyramimonas_sp.AAC.1